MPVPAFQILVVIGGQFEQPPIINATQLLLETFHAVAE